MIHSRDSQHQPRHPECPIWNLPPELIMRIIHFVAVSGLFPSSLHYTKQSNGRFLFIKNIVPACMPFSSVITLKRKPTPIWSYFRFPTRPLLKLQQDIHTPSFSRVYLLPQPATPSPTIDTPPTLSDDGEVYTWGSEAHLGQMGFRSESSLVAEPRRVPDLPKGVSRVYAGCYYSFIVYHGEFDK